MQINIDDWSYEYSDNFSECGIILKNISHAGFNLAKDIRVVNVWVTYYGNTVKLSLGSKELPFQKLEYLPHNTVKPPDPFAEYPIPTGIRCIFMSDTPLISGGSRLKIIQTFLFGEYGNYPAHEPSANLMAARLFPLIKFELPDESEGSTKTKVLSIRVDYRIQYNLDLFLDKKFNEFAKKFGVGPQQAGVFKDSDQLPPNSNDIQLAAIGYFDLYDFFTQDDDEPTKAKEFSRIGFTAAEKPLQYEIVGDGLLLNYSMGSQELSTSTILFSEIREDVERKGNVGGWKYADDSWDNIHFWGGCKGKKLPSTPGAFHAAHIHWRWGKAAQVNVAPTLAPAAGQPQFVGKTYESGQLVDPAIFAQDMKFYIIKSDIDNLAVPFDFEKTLKARRKTKNNSDFPDYIGDGADLALFLTFAAYRPSTTPPFSGTFFIHGLFFAHDSEDNPFFKGSHEEMDKRTSGGEGKRKIFKLWNRNPSE